MHAMTSFQINEQEVVRSLRALAVSLRTYGATAWKEWVDDAYERAAGNNSPAVDWSELLWFARLNYLPVLRFVGNRGARDVSDAFEALLRALLPDWPISVSGFTREGDRHDTTDVFGHLAQAEAIVRSSQEFSRTYCNFLLRQDYASAYAALSKELRGTLSQTTYVRAYERAYSRYGGRPVSSQLYSVPAVYTGSMHSQRLKGPRWPKWVSSDARRSIVQAFITTNEGAETGFYLALYLIASGARYAVAKYEFFTP
jgi:hypothetical protein